MTALDNEYYIMARDYSVIDGKTKFIGFTPNDQYTIDNYRNKNEIWGGSPFFFKADEIELRKKDNWPGEIGDINISSGIIVKPWINDILKHHNIKGLQLWPTIYIGSDEKYHEPLWFMKFYESLECWHRERSILKKPYNPNKRAGAKVKKFSLDEYILLPIPLEKRLILAMKRTLFMPQKFVHISLVEKLKEKNCQGVRFFKVSEYESGMEDKF